MVVSNQVNIWREIEAGEAGIVTIDTRDGIEDALTRWNELSPDCRADDAARTPWHALKRILTFIPCHRG